METIENITFQQKWQNFKMGVKARVKATIQWCKENPQVAASVAAGILAGVTEITKSAIKAKDRREDRELEEKRLNSVYDRSAGMYLCTERPLTNDDWRGVQKRKRDGMTTGEALEDMGLLK